jgi:hypothetical protein
MGNLTRRELMISGGLAALGAMILPESVALHAQTAATNNLSFVNPEMRESARQFLNSSALPELSASTLQAARKGMRSFSGPPLSVPAFTKRSIKGPPGAPDVTIYVVNGNPTTSRAAILHTHGGGYVAGDALGGIAGLQEIAASLDCVIVTVDYRLAPETTFKGSIEDNYAAARPRHFCALLSRSSEISVEPWRCAAAGAAPQRGRLAILVRCKHDRLLRRVLHVINRVQRRLVDLGYCVSDRCVNAAIEASLEREVAAV